VYRGAADKAAEKQRYLEHADAPRVFLAEEATICHLGRAMASDVRNCHAPLLKLLRDGAAPDTSADLAAALADTATVTDAHVVAELGLLFEHLFGVLHSRSAVPIVGAIDAARRVIRRLCHEHSQKRIRLAAADVANWLKAAPVMLQRLLQFHANDAALVASAVCCWIETLLLRCVVGGVDGTEVDSALGQVTQVFRRSRVLQAVFAPLVRSVGAFAGTPAVYNAFARPLLRVVVEITVATDDVSGGNPSKVNTGPLRLYDKVFDGRRPRGQQSLTLAALWEVANLLEQTDPRLGALTDMFASFVARERAVSGGGDSAGELDAFAQRLRTAQLVEGRDDQRVLLTVALGAVPE